MMNLPVNYTQTFAEIKARINQARFDSLKAVNSQLILMYLDLGKVISNRVQNGWGDFVVDKLSVDLQSEFPGVKGFSLRNLRRMKYIYEKCLENSILPQLVAKIPWGHTDLIFTKFKEHEQIQFYIQQCIDRGWSRGTLEEEIRFDTYTQLPAEIAQYLPNETELYNMIESKFLDTEDTNNE